MKRTIALFVMLWFCVTLFSSAQTQSQETLRKPQNERIGIVFTQLVARIVTKDEAEHDLISALQSKMSASDDLGTKLEVVKVNNLEEAKRHGIKIVFSLDYVEKAGKYLGSGSLVGRATDFFCTFKRSDEMAITTNWDTLSITYVLEGTIEQSSGAVSFTLTGNAAERVLRSSFGFPLFVEKVPVLRFNEKREVGLFYRKEEVFQALPKEDVEAAEIDLNISAGRKRRSPVALEGRASRVSISEKSPRFLAHLPGQDASKLKLYPVAMVSGRQRVVKFMIVERPRGFALPIVSDSQPKEIALVTRKNAEGYIEIELKRPLISGEYLFEAEDGRIWTFSIRTGTSVKRKAAQPRS